MSLSALMISMESRRRLLRSLRESQRTSLEVSGLAGLIRRNRQTWRHFSRSPLSSISISSLYDSIFCGEKFCGCHLVQLRQWDHTVLCQGTFEVASRAALTRSHLLYNSSRPMTQHFRIFKFEETWQLGFECKIRPR